jgi:phage gp36-like protein
LVQTAYAALEEAIKGLGGSTLKILTVKGEKPELDQATAKRFLEDVHAQLDMLIH